MKRVPIRSKANPKRATILLMVVSLLALLFVIITGFLALSRSERQTADYFRRGELINSMIDDVQAQVQRLALADITDDKGKVLAGPGSVWTQVPGRGKT